MTIVEGRRRVADVQIYVQTTARAKWIKAFNPLPPLVLLNRTRMRGATAAAVWAAGDRPRGTVGEVWVGTKYNRPRLTTARRRAPALSLCAAPRSGVGDVPTA